jgi:hypothetical protein
MFASEGEEMKYFVPFNLKMGKYYLAKSQLVECHLSSM